MPVIKQRIPWTSQPQSRARLAPAYAANATIAWIPSSPDVVTGKVPTLDAQASYKVNSGGRSLYGDGSGYTGQAAMFSSQPDMPTTHTDMVVMSSWSSGTQNGGLLTNSDKYGLQVAHTTGQLVWVQGSVTIELGMYVTSGNYTIICRHIQGVSVQVFVNGIAGSVISTGRELGFTGRTFPVNIGSDTIKQHIYLAYSVSRYLLDGEVASLSQNPWQIFAP